MLSWGWGVWIPREDDVKPKIVEKGRILLAGMSFFGDPFSLSAEWTEENEIGRLWSRFLAYMGAYDERIGSLIKDMRFSYEVHITHDETQTKGHYEIFTGMEIAHVEGVPIDLLVKVLPSSTYAVFTLEGEDIIEDWGWEIYHEWMPDSGYRVDERYIFQLYDERFKGMDQLEGSVLDVYIPIERVE
jgi:AraC family transcriptional regulator